MTRGHRPKVTVEDAKRYAAAMKYTVIDGFAPLLPFDFMISRNDLIMLVRVRRLRFSGYDPESITTRCAEEIREIRASIISGIAARELWVRGPGGGWHRYRVEADRIIALTPGDSSEGAAGQQNLVTG